MACAIARLYRGTITTYTTILLRQIERCPGVHHLAVVGHAGVRSEVWRSDHVTAREKRTLPQYLTTSR